MPQTTTLPGRTALINGQEYLYFSGTSYLGLHKNPVFLEKIKEGLDKYGSHFGSSRLSNLEIDIFNSFENDICDWTGTEAAALFSSGFLAGQALARYFHQEKFNCYYLKKSHPAMWIPEPLRVIMDIEEAITEQGKTIVVFTNSVDPLMPQKHDFSWAYRVKESIILVIDDSHYFGIGGNGGRGIISELNLPKNIQVVILSSLGKAFTIPGGVLLGSKSLIDILKRSPFFGGASPPALPYLFAFMKCKDIFDQQRKRLIQRVEQFKKGISFFDLLQSFDKYPVFYTSQNELAEFLLQKKVAISSFAYPSPEDELFTRIVLNGLHTEEDVSTLLGYISEFNY